MFFSTILHSFTFAYPHCIACIAWHAPVASRTEGNTAYFRTVRQAGTLELLGEEPSAKCCQPLLYCAVIVLCGDAFVAVEGLLSKKVNF